MAGGIFNNKDSMDISELASLNEDISDDLIDQLQQKLTQNIAPPKTKDEGDDSALFEEVTTNNTNEDTAPTKSAKLENQDPKSSAESGTQESFDDKFLKKYKEKLQKKAMSGDASIMQNSSEAESSTTENEAQDSNATKKDDSIEKLTQGNISEKPLTKDLKEYNDSLDFLDGNVKYSKYVIYIDPQNVDFIEGLTVKERKNLINRILRQQDDISITKKKFKIAKTIFFHAFIAIIVFLASVPIVYHMINASLEATIDNHRNAQAIWQTLYKEHGKITKH